jgi:hypothetical protein
LSTTDAAAGAGMAVLEKTSGATPVFDEFGEIDDILGELAGPAPVKPVDAFDDLLGEITEPSPPAKPDVLDDILGELASPPPVKPVDEFDDILGEIAEASPPPKPDNLDDILGELAAPPPVEPVDEFDDILGEITEASPPPKSNALDDILGELASPPPVKPVDEFDDILGEMASPPPARPADDLEDILGEAAAPAPAEAAEPKPRKRAKAASQPAAADDIDEAQNSPSPEPESSETALGALEAPAIAAAQGGKRRSILGAFRPNLGGTRQVSRKVHAAMQAAIVVLGLTAAAEAAVILTRPATASGAAGHGPPPVVKVTVIPVDYAKVDLGRYVGKVRTLSEGGRDLLRHPKVRAAIIGLDGGEQLYKDLRAIAAHSPPADRMAIRDDRVTIASCDGGACGDRRFRLVYDIPHEQAAVCTTERYPDGSLASYGYSMSGNSPLPHC